MKVTFLQVVTLVRLVSFMVLVYLLLGLLVEVNSKRPDSKLKAFFRVVCSPVTRPVARLVADGASQKRLLGVSLVVVGAVWIASILLSGAVRTP